MRPLIWADYGQAAVVLPLLPSALATVLGVCGTASGQCELAKLSASDGADNDRLGKAVSISGHAAIIGAFLDDDACPGDSNCNSGSAYVYRLDREISRWNEESKLTASDAAGGDWYGRSVSISGDLAVVGAYRDDDAGHFSGSAYVYRFDPESSQWHEEAKLTASDAAPDDRFGLSVSISGDVALIGASLDDDGGTDSGSAYVYRFNGIDWCEQAKLTASDAAPEDFFGVSVFVAGDLAVIGASDDDDVVPNSGSAYVYRFNGTGWYEEAKLTAFDAAQFDNFGLAVSISGNVALIGAPDDDPVGFNSGSAYVYRFDGTDWHKEAKLSASDGEALDHFGSSVAVSGNTVLVGAADRNDNSGSAYVYRFDGDNWFEEAQLTASDVAVGWNFGASVAMSGDLSLIGAFGADDVGGAYVFAGVSGADCNDNGEPDACDIASGTSTDANGNGIPDECECPWDLDGDGVVNVLDLIQLVMSFGPCEGCPADFNDDGIVDVLDLIELIHNLGPCPGFDECPWDIDGDGEVDLSDLFSVLSNLGPCDDPGNCPWDFNGDGVVDGADVLELVANFGPCP